MPATPSATRLVPGLRKLLLGAVGLAAASLSASPAEACPYLSSSRDPNRSYVAVCVGAEFGEERVIYTRFDRDDPLGNSYILSAASSRPDDHGSSRSSARVSEVRFGDIYLNPDLHAAISGETRSLGSGGLLTVGSTGAESNAAFRDIIKIRSLPPGAGRVYPFKLDYDIQGTVFGSGDTNSASQGWVGVTFNLGIYEENNPTNTNGSGVGFFTVDGKQGHQSASVQAQLDVEANKSYVIEGVLDMLGQARGEDPGGATFNADFANSARFRGIHIYSDDTLTTELTGYTIESAFGFDYRVNAPVATDVPEPGSLALLASAAGFMGLIRRRSRPNAMSPTLSNRYFS